MTNSDVHNQSPTPKLWVRVSVIGCGRQNLWADSEGFVVLTHAQRLTRHPVGWPGEAVWEIE